MPTPIARAALARPARTAESTAAYEAMEGVRAIRLSLDDQKRFADALLVPPAPNMALVRAFKRRRELADEG